MPILQNVMVEDADLPALLPQIPSGRGQASGSSPTFSPLDIVGASLWLRADLGITISTGVSAWADQSSAGNIFVQGTAGNQPNYTTNAYNGQPAVGGPDAARYLQCASIATLGTTASIVITCSQSSVASAYIATPDGANTAFLSHFSGSAFEWYNGTGSDRYTFALTPTAGLHQLIVTQTDGASLIGYYDGVQVFSAVPTVTINRQFKNVCGRGTGVNGTNGSVVECITYSGVILTPSQVQQLHMYSRAFWGSP